MSCAEETDFPSFADVESKFGKAGTILLYSFSSIILSVNIVLFSFSVYSFIKSGYLTKSQVFSWTQHPRFNSYLQIIRHSFIVSVPLHISIYQLLSITTFRAEQSILNLFHFLESVVIFMFAKTSLEWLGGPQHILDVSEKSTMNFNLPPFCCCFTFLRNKVLTKRKLRIVRILILQLIIVAFLSLTVKQIIVNYERISRKTLAAKNPLTFLDVVERISFFLSIYALFILYKVKFYHWNHEKLTIVDWGYLQDFGKRKI